MNTRKPDFPEVESILVDETPGMEREQRLVEQQGHRKLARVNARDHAENEAHNTPEGELQNDILQHPDLDSPPFDGIDKNVNPIPAMSSEAGRKYANEQNKQAAEKQLRLEHQLGATPRLSTAPRPHGPN